jgi:PhoH-like ATPase
VAALIERLKGEPLFGHVTLLKGERSPVAELVARRL